MRQAKCVQKAGVGGIEVKHGLYRGTFPTKKLPFLRTLQLIPTGKAV